MALKLIGVALFAAFAVVAAASFAAIQGSNTPARAARSGVSSHLSPASTGGLPVSPQRTLNADPTVVEADIDGPDEPATGGYLLAIVSPNTDDASLPSWNHADGRKLRLREVPSMADALALETSDIGAIAVDAALVDDVDWGWLQRQFDAGKSVVGLNIPMGTLLDKLYPASAPLLGENGLGWTRGQPNAASNEGHLYFSALYGPPCQAGVTLKYDDPEGKGIFASTLWMMSCGTSVVGFERSE